LSQLEFWKCENILKESSLYHAGNLLVNPFLHQEFGIGGGELSLKESAREHALKRLCAHFPPSIHISSSYSFFLIFGGPPSPRIFYIFLYNFSNIFFQKNLKHQLNESNHLSVEPNGLIQGDPRRRTVAARGDNDERMK
jgi:hypothetical protein